MHVILRQLLLHTSGRETRSACPAEQWCLRPRAGQAGRCEEGDVTPVVVEGRAARHDVRVREDFHEPRPVGIGCVDAQRGHFVDHVAAADGTVRAGEPGAAPRLIHGADLHPPACNEGVSAADSDSDHAAALKGVQQCLTAGHFEFE